MAPKRRGRLLARRFHNRSRTEEEGASSGGGAAGGDTTRDRGGGGARRERPGARLTRWHSRLQYASALHWLHVILAPSFSHQPQMPSATLPFLPFGSVVLVLVTFLLFLAALPLPLLVPARSSGWGFWKRRGS